MIPNRWRPWLALHRLLAMAGLLRLLGHRVAGWKYFFGDWSVIRLGPGRLVLEGGNWIEAGARLELAGGAIRLGRRTFVNAGSILIARTGIDIGHDALIADHVTIVDHDHASGPTEMPYGQRGYVCAPITIGDRAWIGSHVVIVKGVYIGADAIIAAGAVVTGEVPAGEVWGGVPARRIRSAVDQVRPAAER